MLSSINVPPSPVPKAAWTGRSWWMACCGGCCLFFIVVGLGSAALAYWYGAGSAHTVPPFLQKLYKAISK